MGGEIEGVELAVFLSQRGRDVTIVDENPMRNLGKGLPRWLTERFVAYIQTHGVNTLMNVKYREITDKGIQITTDYGISKTLEADNIVLALPLVKYTTLFDSLQNRVPEVYAIGDCATPGLIVDAVASANLTARKI
jgi:pyruvate/2-oxoglutarate dehydrogenase complex dihydrolipoamide dehydrogenase (E3) component